MSGTDKRVVACNYAVARKHIPLGALAYLCQQAGDAERVRAVTRSRSGRWIEKWEKRERLTNFRWKTLPPEHPRYTDGRIADWLPPTYLDGYRAAGAA